MRERLAFTADVIDKQYRSYNWNDTKVQALVTIDTALVAGILVFIQLLGVPARWLMVLLQAAMTVLLASLVICLIHAVPKINSRVGNQWNHRTMLGIYQYTKKGKRDGYYQYITSTCDQDAILKMNCSQIVGMCKNNWRSARLIFTGVSLTIVGVSLLTAALLGWTFYQGSGTDFLQNPQQVQNVEQPPATITAPSDPKEEKE